jgi:hypothetical protein
LALLLWQLLKLLVKNKAAFVMKNILKIAVILAFLAGASVVHAQMRDSVTTINTKKAMPGEYVYITNDIVMKHKEGYNTGLASTYYCTDGSTITTDHMLTRKDGSKVMLKNGDIVYKNGRLDTSGEK